MAAKLRERTGVVGAGRGRARLSPSPCPGRFAFQREAFSAWGRATSSRSSRRREERRCQWARSRSGSRVGSAGRSAGMRTCSASGGGNSGTKARTGSPPRGGWSRRRFQAIGRSSARRGR